MRLVGRRAGWWLTGLAVLVALACLVWWLAAGGTRGAAIAGALAAVTGLVAAGGAVWPLLRAARPADGGSQPSSTRPEVRNELPAVPGTRVPPGAGTPYSSMLRDLCVARNAVPDVGGRATSAMTMRRPRGRSHALPVRLRGQIGLWGPPDSGKTCFLSALNAAVAQTVPPWTLVGATEASTAWITQCTADMIGARIFPSRTDMGEEYEIRALLSGEVDIPVKHFVQRRADRLSVQLELSILDVGGEYFVGQHGMPNHLVEYLAACDGIAFFFDPTHQSALEEYEYFQRAVAQFEHELQLRHALHDLRLPHRVAVCIAKYDEPEVLEVARKGDHLVVRQDDPYGFPRVADERAEAFFEELCTGSVGGEASLLGHAIRRYFHSDRIRYFAVSSIGFYVDHTKRFDWDNYYNVLEKYHHIRGQICPVNVLEPLLWLTGPGPG